MNSRKPLRCYTCGKIVGWAELTGKYHKGVPQVKVKMKPNCIWTTIDDYPAQFCEKHKVTS